MSIEEVQNKLGAIIKKPKLQENLLQKPPFRFLHDIVMEVLSETGFGRGLYAGDELNAKAIDGKEAKINFLDKIIACTSIAVGKEIDVSSSKIVAGKEAEKTCAWLVELATACTSSVNFDTCAAKALAKFGGATSSSGASESKSGDGDDDAKRRAEEDAAKASEKAKLEAEETEKKAQEARKRERKAQEEADRKRSEDAAVEEQKEAERQRQAAKAMAAEAERPSRAAAPRSSPIPSAPSEDGLSLKLCDGEMSRTIDFLGPLIDRPKLTTKLLEKPPFRFLHDIYMSVVSQTNFGEGLYSGAELDGKGIDSKEGKQSFLDKMINCVYLYLGGFPIDDIVKSSKIVAGKEPEKTNMFLQHLAVAASRCKAGASCGKAVRDTLNGVQPSVDDKGSSQPAPVAIASAPKSESKIQDSMDAAPSRPKPVKATTRFDDDRGSTTNITSSTPPPASNTINTPVSSSTVSDRQMEHEDESKTSSNTTLPNDSTGGHENETSIKRVERPRTARKKPPKLKENSNEESKMGTKNSAAPVGIFVDGEHNNDNLNDSDDEQTPQINKTASAVEVDGDANHSKLVQKILEEEKKQDNKKDKSKDKSGVKDDEKGKDDAGGIRMGKIRKAQRGNETSNAPPVELNELRLAIQKLTQSTNPLGKCMDYVHDDLEIMSKELEQWKSEYRVKCDSLEEEVRKTEEDLQPFHMRMMEVNERIRDQTLKIYSLKSQISRNEKRITELLRLVVSS